MALLTSLALNVQSNLNYRMQIDKVLVGKFIRQCIPIRIDVDFYSDKD